MAKDLESILKLENITPEDVAGIAILASVLKWRTPVKDKEFNEIKNDLTATDLSVEIRIKGEDHNVEQGHIRTVI